MELLLLPFFLLYHWIWPVGNIGDVALSEKGRRVINDPVLADKMHRAIQIMNSTGARSATVEGLTVRRL